MDHNIHPPHIAASTHRMRSHKHPTYDQRQILQRIEITKCKTYKIYGGDLAKSKQWVIQKHTVDPHPRLQGKDREQWFKIVHEWT